LNTNDIHIISSSISGSRLLTKTPDQITLFGMPKQEDITP